MRYITLELKGYKRLSLNQIETIKLTPENKFHWILGTNGSGKSSLIREITPLAATPSNYHKGGYKKVHVEDKGVEYKLTSDFTGPKNLFSFIRITNGTEEELNPGHTSTVFNNLVLQVFGITKDIHEFSLGSKEFTRMSSMDRKQWMTKLSSVDYTFALQYFKKLTGVYRDLLGSVKTDQNRLIEAKQHLVSPEHVQVLEAQITALKEQLQYTNSICPNPTVPYSVTQQQFTELQNKILEARAKQKKILQNSVHLLPLESQETLVAKTHQITSRMELLNEQKTRAFERLDSYRKQLDQHVLLHNADQTSIELFIIDAKSSIEQLKSTLEYGFSQNSKQALEEFFSWLGEVELIVPTLVPDVNGELNEDNYAVNYEKLQHAQRSLGQLDLQKAKLQKDLEEAKECARNPSVTCPACNHHWIPGHSEANIRKFETLLEEVKETRKKYQVSHDDLLEEVTLYGRYKKGIDYLNNIVWKYPNFKPFWESVFHHKEHLLTPEVIVGKAFQFKSQLETMIQIEDLEVKVKESFHKLDLLKNTSQQNILLIQGEHDRLEKDLDSIFNELEDLSKQKTYLAGKSKLSEYLENLRTQTEKDKKALEDVFENSFEHFQRAKLSDLMLKTNSELLQIEKQIRSVEIQKGQIEMLESNLEKTKEQAKVLKAAVDALSPSSGLIAKGLTGFINHFVALANSVIKKVWLYPMELIPVLPDEDDQIELDYKFMVKVKDDVVPDIEQCSSGQQEIINLAIRIVALSFLRLDHGPLFLDEFGARMDTAHKASAFEMISKLLVHSNFTQIFMISHFEGIQTQGLEADITVLCPANIQLPPGVMFNKNTEIT